MRILTRNEANHRMNVSAIGVIVDLRPRLTGRFLSRDLT